MDLETQNKENLKRLKTIPVSVGGSLVGGSAFVVIAGPCSVESESQFRLIANSVKEAGAIFLRGGIYKLRTNPKSFQGLGSEGSAIVRKICKELKMPLVSEITDARQIEEFHDTVDLFQVGTRNMYNYSLLSELGKTKKPILLKRAFSALVDEWLLAADYIVQGGNDQVILCERGIRSFETVTRNTLDLSAVAYVKAHTQFPIIVDPSHGTGRRELVAPMSYAAASCGADGLLIEVHPDPAHAMSDGAQTLDFSDFTKLMSQLEKILQVFDRPLK